VGVAMAALAWFLLGVPAATGAVLGAAMSGLSLVLLAKAVKNLVAGGRSSWALVAVFKFAFLLVLTYWVLRSRWVSPLGLALGFGALPLGIVLSSLSPKAASSHGELSTAQKPTRKD